MAKAATTPPKKASIVVHSKLAAETVDELDQLASQNNITRAAAIAIAVSRLIKTGI